MREYTFKYKPYKRNLKSRINLLLSNFLFSLYRNKLFQKLKLNKNGLIRHSVEKGEERYNFQYKIKIPKNLQLEPYTITLYDLVDFDELIDNKKKFIRILSKYKGGFLQKDPEKEINKSLKKLKDSYKTISYGRIYYNDLKDDSKTDLINGISYDYVKGKQSFMLLIYTIFPSQKFKDLFKEYINKTVKDESEIIFNSIRNIIKGKKWITSIHYKPIYPYHRITKLYNEINYQFKKRVISDLNMGVFNTNRKFLFPNVITYEYDKTQTESYLKEFFNRMRIIQKNLYSDDSVFIHFPDNYSSGMEVFIPKTSDSEKQKDPFSSVEYLSETYLSAISPFWTLLSVTNLYKSHYVKIRRKMYSYLSKGKDSIFLKKAINLKRKINFISWQLERICKDFSSKIYESHLEYHGISNLKNNSQRENVESTEFRKDLINSTKHATNELIDSFKDISTTFEKINSDNLVKTNMKLQRLLLFIAVLSILLTIYSANSEWFNDIFIKLIAKL